MIKFNNSNYKISTYKDIGTGLAEVTFVRKLSTRVIIERKIVREETIKVDK
jgi:hypothetical protein